MSILSYLNAIACAWDCETRYAYAKSINAVAEIENAIAKITNAYAKSINVFTDIENAITKITNAIAKFMDGFAEIENAITKITNAIAKFMITVAEIENAFNFDIYTYTLSHPYTQPKQINSLPQF